MVTKTLLETKVYRTKPNLQTELTKHRNLRIGSVWVITAGLFAAIVSRILLFQKQVVWLGPIYLLIFPLHFSTSNLHYFILLQSPSLILFILLFYPPTFVIGQSPPHPPSHNYSRDTLNKQEIFFFVKNKQEL